MRDLKVKVSLKWWFKYYLMGLCFFSSVTGATPSEDKVSKMVRHGIKVDLA